MQESEYSRQIKIEEARTLKRENDIAEGRFVSVSLIEKALDQMTEHLQDLPKKLKEVLPSLTEADIEIVEASVAQCKALVEGNRPGR